MRLRFLAIAVVVLALAAVAAPFVLSGGGGGGGAEQVIAASGCVDIDGDGTVHLIDATMVLDYFGQNVPPAPPQVDVNKSGNVSIGDFFAAALAFRTSTACQGSPLGKSSLSGGALAVDADGESTGSGDPIQAVRVAMLGVPFHVSVQTTANPGIVGSELELHWDEARLNLNARTADANDLWVENIPAPSSLPYQAAGPADNGSGTDAYLALAATFTLPPTVSYFKGPLAQFEFTCQSSGIATIFLSGYTKLAARPATEYTPTTLASADIDCGSPTPTPTPAPGSPVNVAGNWYLQVAGDATGSCYAVASQLPAATSTSWTGVCVTPGFHFDTLNGSINTTTGFFAISSSGGSCVHTLFTGTATSGGTLASGNWKCGPYNGTFTGTREADGDGLASSVDPNTGVFGSTFSDTISSGVINARNGVTVFIDDVLFPGGVRAIAVGPMGAIPANVSYCTSPAFSALLQSTWYIDITCASVTVEVLQGPLQAFANGVILSLPTGAKATASEPSPGVLQVENSISSAATIIVGGLSLAPGNSLTPVPDGDGDGLTDSVETNTGTYVSPSNTGTNPTAADTDADGLKDGPEVLIYSTNAFVVDTDLDGCRDGQETGPVPSGGGQRTPTNFWDFYDVWTHPPMLSSWQRTKVVDIDEIISAGGIAARFATMGNPAGNPLTQPASDSGYHVDYDRTFAGPLAWNLGPADGVIGIDEIFWVVDQIFHSCA